MATSIPPLPNGYKLDAAQNVPPLPAGYQLDSQSQDSGNIYSEMIHRINGPKQQDTPWYQKPLISGDTMMNVATLGHGKQIRENAKNYVNPNSPTGTGVVRGVNGAVADTFDTASAMTSPVGIATAAAGAFGRVGKAVQTLAAPVFAYMGAKDAANSGAKPGDVGQALAYGLHVSDTPPNASPEQIQQLLAGSGNAALGTAATVAGTKGAAAKISPRGSMSGRMNTKLPGEQFTPQQILEAARAKGINLDLADATGSGVARGVKAYSERSLGGSGRMRANTETNLQALEKWADAEAKQYAPESTPRETLGSQVSNKLQEDLAAKKTAASESFSDLDKRVGTNTIDGTNTVEAEARAIIGEMKDYYAKHPELKPKQAWSIIENLAERPKVDKLNAGATAPGLQDVNGKPMYATGTVTKGQSAAHYFSWNELHNLRSDLMDIYRNDPEIIKSKSGAWLQRMVSTIDQTMTDSATGLKPQDLKQFRAANATWEDIKSTYDNPQHPFHQERGTNASSDS